MHHKYNDFENYLLEHNLLGIISLEKLYSAERDITYHKSLILEQTPIDGDFNYLHLKKIHHFLFEEIYDFAGKDRFELGIEYFGKGNSKFILASDIPMWEKIIFDEISKKNYLLGLESKIFIKEITSLFADINALHPFREGNGRVQRIFVNQLAKKAGYFIDFSKVSQLECVLSAKDAMVNNLTKMERMFEKIISPSS